MGKECRVGLAEVGGGGGGAMGRESGVLEGGESRGRNEGDRIQDDLEPVLDSNVNEKL